MNRPPAGPPDIDSFEWEDADDRLRDPVRPVLPDRHPEVPQPHQRQQASGQHDVSPSRKEPPPPSRQLPLFEGRAAPSRRLSRRQETDPVFIYLVLMAFSVGLMPLTESNPIERYTILWTLLAGVGVAAFFLGDEPLFGQVKVNDLLWGSGLGVMLGAPLLLVGAGILAQASDKIFFGLPDGAVFQSVVFVMSSAETLFFRGVLQRSQPWLITALMAAGWSILLFFPAVAGFLYPALVISTFIVMLSILYSYVNQRNGLAAAWTCQIVVSVLWLFVPRLLA